MKAFMTLVLTLALATGMVGCARTGGNGESGASTLPPTSMTSSAPAIASSSEPHPVSELEKGLNDTASDVASAVKPTMSTDFDKIGAHSANQVKWGPGTQRDPENNRTTDTEKLQDIYGKYSAYFIAPKDTGKFYLTFDEGYENGYTPTILDVLKEKKVKAVFFVTLPYAKSHPELIQRMIDEGHIIGNHTNHHWNPTQVSLQEAKSDIKDLHDYMLENYQYEMTLYRPPEGAFSEQTLALAQQMGYTTVLWSFAYNDWDPNNQIGDQAALQRTTTYIHEGGIYLLHAVSRDNAHILGALIDQIQDKGLKITKFDLPHIPAKP